MSSYYVAYDKKLGVNVHNYPEKALRAMGKPRPAGRVYRAWDRQYDNRYKVTDGVTPLKMLPFIYRSDVHRSLYRNGFSICSFSGEVYKEISIESLEECLNA